LDELGGIGMQIKKPTVIKMKDPIIEVGIPEGYDFFTKGIAMIRKSRAIFKLWSAALNRSITVTPNGVED
jgi:hypothetical protein